MYLLKKPIQPFECVTPFSNPSLPKFNRSIQLTYCTCKFKRYESSKEEFFFAVVKNASPFLLIDFRSNDDDDSSDVGTEMKAGHTRRNAVWNSHAETRLRFIHIEKKWKRCLFLDKIIEKFPVLFTLCGREDQSEGLYLINVPDKSLHGSNALFTRNDTD